MATNRFTCDPNLTGNLTAEYEALQNDLEQAKLLAADYQNQLSDKSNDFATLKLALEKTTSDLEKLQQHIVALREERHNLANEVMRVVLLEAKVKTLTEENKRLREAAETGAEIVGDLRTGRPSRREFIEVDPDVPESLVVIPAAPAARPPGPFRPR